MSAPTLTRQTTLDGRYARAEDRANASTHRVWQMGPNHYRVASFTTPGVAYDIHVTMSGLRCNCPAGQAKQPCKHASLVSNRLRREFKSTQLFEQFIDTSDDDNEWLQDIPQIAIPEPERQIPSSNSLCCFPDRYSSGDCPRRAIGYHLGRLACADHMPLDMEAEPDHTAQANDMAPTNVVPSTPRPTLGGAKLEGMFFD